jgi:hypothetical protein
MASLNAFGTGEERQQPRVFSLPSLLVRTLLFPLVCGLFLKSFMVQALAISQQFAGRFGADLALFLVSAMQLWTRDTLKVIIVVRLHFFFRTGLILMSFMLMFSMTYLLELPRVVLGELLLLRTFKTLLKRLAHGDFSRAKAVLTGATWGLKIKLIVKDFLHLRCVLTV